MADKPAFEVITDHHHYRVYADGRVEGFPADGKQVVINRIPQIHLKAALEVVDEVCGVKRYSPSFPIDRGPY